MTDTHEYRCLACEDATVSRDFDVSHLSRTCDVCGEFGRFVNTIVLDQLEALEAESPERLHWEDLDRSRKFLIAERLTRGDYSIDDFEVAAPEDEAADEAEENTADSGDTDDEDEADGDGDESGGGTEETDAAVIESDAANANGAGEDGE